MKARALILLTALATGTLVFTVLDQGLSGGSAANPGYAAVIILISLIAGLAIIRGDEGLARIIAMAFTALPLLLLAYCGFASMQWNQRPEVLARKQLAENIRCATKKAGVPEGSRKLVKIRTHLIEKYGDAGGAEQRAIEQRLGIRIHPNCGFERL